MIAWAIRTQFPQTFVGCQTLIQLTSKRERSNLASFNQLVQELISGTVQRHVFTQWELELLLDLQTCSIRKSARADVLRRYLKAVQQHFSSGASNLLRLSAFIEQENHHHRAVSEPAAAAQGSVPFTPAERKA